MATNKDITMRQFNGVDYDTLYPKTLPSQILGLDNYIVSQTSSLYLPKTGGSMGGVLNMNGNRISNLGTPTESTDATTKAYVDENKVFELKELGVITTVNQQVPITFNDFVLCKGILVELSIDVLDKIRQQYYMRVYLNFVGTETYNLDILNFYNSGVSATTYNNLKSTIFLTKVIAVSNNNNDSIGYSFGEGKGLFLNLNTDGYFTIDRFSGSGLDCKISLIM